jgi:hypothetical protein
VLTSGNYNIDIGWGVGASGAATESGVIRIGDPMVATNNSFSYTTYIAGISSSKITGAAVYVTASGQLGVLASSERYKSDITSLSSSTAKLQQLRPVTFHLKSEPSGALQYGLIAEEVDKVYPELVIRDDKGQIEGVRYDELAPILLSEVQQQREKLAAQEQTLVIEAERLGAQDQKLAAQAAELGEARVLFAAQQSRVASLETLVRDMQQQIARLNTDAMEPQLAMH